MADLQTPGNLVPAANRHAAKGVTPPQPPTTLEALSSHIHFEAVPSPVGLVKLVGGSISAFEDPKRTSIDHFKAIKVCSSLPSRPRTSPSNRDTSLKRAYARKALARFLQLLSPEGQDPADANSFFTPDDVTAFSLASANSANTEIFRAFCHHRARGGKNFLTTASHVLGLNPGPRFHSIILRGCRQKSLRAIFPILSADRLEKEYAVGVCRVTLRRRDRL